MNQIKLSRWCGDGTRVAKEDWKDLISSLALSGYEVYADNEQIVFTLGDDDIVIDKDRTPNSIGLGTEIGKSGQIYNMKEHKWVDK